MAWIEFDQLAQALRVGSRRWARQPLLAIAIFAMITVSVGLNTTAFALLHAVLFRALPYPQASRLAAVGRARPDCPWCALPVSIRHLDAWQRRVPAGDMWAAYRGTTVVAEFGGKRRTLDAVLVTPSVFQLFDIRVRLGSPLRPDDGEVGGPRRAVLGATAWRTMFGGDSAAIGKWISIDGRQIQIAGVLDPSSSLPESGDYQIWATPAALGEGPDAMLSAFVRLRAGTTLELARQQVAAAEQSAFRTARERIVVVSLRRKLAITASLGLVVLQALAVILLIIGAANVTGLIVAKTEAERHVVGLRLVLGARGRDLMMAALGDILILVSAGLVGGLLFAAWGVPFARTLLDLPTLPGETAGLSASVVVLAIGAAGLVAVIASLGIARDMLSSDLRRWLQEGSSGAVSGVRVRRTMGRLVTIQLGLAITLAVAATALLANYLRLVGADNERADTGSAISSITVSTSVRPGEAAAQLEASLARVGRFAGGELRVPYYLDAPSTTNDTVYVDDNRVADALSPAPRGMGIVELAGSHRAHRMVQGRFFSNEEMRAAAPDQIVVNEAFAQRVWQRRSAIGRRVRLPGVGAAEGWRTVVGVISDPSGEDAVAGGRSRPSFLLPGFRDATNASVVVFIRGDVTGLLDSLTNAISRDIPHANVLFENADARRAEARRNERTRTMLVVALAVVSLLMALAGLVALIRYATQLRQREFAIRFALGSSRYGVAVTVVRDALLLSRNGLVIGIAGCLAAHYVIIPAVYYGARLGSWQLGLAVVVTATATTVLAALSSAVRASRLDPAALLREG